MPPYVDELKFEIGKCAKIENSKKYFPKKYFIDLEKSFLAIARNVSTSIMSGLIQTVK